MAVSVAEWAGGDSDDEVSAWALQPRAVYAPPGGALFLSWWFFHTQGLLPDAGGYFDQDLKWITHAQVFSMLYATFHNRHAESFKMDKLSKLQLALLTWIEKDETPDGG